MEYVRLRNCTNYIKGFAFSSKEFVNDETQKMVVRVSDFTMDSISQSEAVYIEESDKYANFILHEGDILIQTVGSWANNPNSIVGKVVRVPKECEGSYLNQNIVKIIPHGINSKYLYYALKANQFSTYCVMRGQGAANQASITLDTIFRFNFPIHQRHEQDKIADILSNYDELIENNNKRIKILEQMAENLYKEWFAYHKIKDLSKEVRLREIIQIVRGLSYSTEGIEVDEGNNLINLKNIQSFGGFRRDGTKLYAGKYKQEQIVKYGDLIMGVTDMTQDRRTVGSVALIPQIEGVSVISADLIKINSNISNLYLYAMFKYGNISKYISQFANGANVLHLKPQAVLNVKVVLPPEDMIEKYVNLVEPLIDEIEQLNQTNDNLVKQRDMLLPRLMSGKLEVKENQGKILEFKPKKTFAEFKNEFKAAARKDGGLNEQDLQELYNAYCDDSRDE